MQSWVKGTVLKCSPWLRDAVMAKLFPTGTHPPPPPSFFGSLSSSIFWNVDIFHNLDPNFLFSHHTLLLDLKHSQGKQKQHSKSESRAPASNFDLLGLTVKCFSLGKLTSISSPFLSLSVESTFSHSADSKQKLTLLCFPLHPTNYLDGPQFLSISSFKLMLIHSFYLLLWLHIDFLLSS